MTIAPTRTVVRTPAPGIIRLSVLAPLAVVSALLATSAPCAAQLGGGIRGGTSIAPARRIPDVTAQLYLGAHVETPPLVGRLVLRPNVEVGFGDDLVLIAVNGELVWRFPTTASGWTAYVGGGPAVSLFRFGAERVDHSDDQFDAGAIFLVGFEHRPGVFVEFKVGVANRSDIAEPLVAPVAELKVGVGYTWR